MVISSAIWAFESPRPTSSTTRRSDGVNASHPNRAPVVAGSRAIPYRASRPSAPSRRRNLPDRWRGSRASLERPACARARAWSARRRARRTGEVRWPDSATAPSRSGDRSTNPRHQWRVAAARPAGSGAAAASWSTASASRPLPPGRQGQPAQIRSQLEQAQRGPEPNQLVPHGLEGGCGTRQVAAGLEHQRLDPQQQVEPLAIAAPTVVEPLAKVLLCCVELVAVHRDLGQATPRHRVEEVASQVVCIGQGCLCLGDGVIPLPGLEPQLAGHRLVEGRVPSEAQLGRDGPSPSQGLPRLVEPVGPQLHLRQQQVWEVEKRPTIAGPHGEAPLRGSPGSRRRRGVPAGPRRAP